MQKKWQNAITSSFTLYGGITSLLYAIWQFIRWVFELDGAVDTINKYKPLMIAPLNYSFIDWPSVNFFIFIIGACFLVAINFDWLSRNYKKRKFRKQVVWDTPIKSAIWYINENSSFGKSFEDIEKDTLACFAIKQNVLSGDLPMAGSSKQKLNSHRIPLETLKKSDFFIQLDDTRYTRKKYITSSIREKDEKKTTLYFNLFFDKRDLERIWPPHY